MSVISEEGADLRRRHQSQQLGDAESDDASAATKAAAPALEKDDGDGDGTLNTDSKDADMGSLLEDNDDEDK